MPSCVVKVCKNHSGMKRNDQAITFHRFPTSNKVWRKQLIDVIQISRGDKNWKPSKYSVICSIHFDASDLYFTKEGLAKLVDLALPTKYLFAPVTVTCTQHLKPAAPNTTLIQPATVQEPCASTLELLSEIPSGAVIVARVYKYLQKEYEELKARSGDAPALSSLGDILGRTAAATGLSQRAVSAVLEADALKPYQGKRSAKPEISERKRPKYNSEDEDVRSIEEESDDDDEDSATQEEPCERENDEDGLIETLKVEFYEDDDYDEYAQTNAGEQISRLQDIGSSEASSSIQNSIASIAAKTQDGEVTKSAISSSADPITDTPHAVKKEIPDDEYRIASSSIQNSIASIAAKTQDGEVTKSAISSSADPITDTPHAVKKEIPDDEYRIASSANQNLIASTVARTQDSGATNPGASSSADPIAETPHPVKEEIPDDEYRILAPRNSSSHCSSDAYQFKKVVLESQEELLGQPDKVTVPIEIEDPKTNFGAPIHMKQEKEYALHKEMCEADTDIPRDQMFIDDPDDPNYVGTDNPAGPSDMQYEEVEYLEDDDNKAAPDAQTITTERRTKTSSNSEPAKKLNKPKNERCMTYKQYSEEELRNCFEAVRNEEMTVFEASEKYNVPKKTIWAKIKSDSKGPPVNPDKIINRDRMFHLIQEMKQILTYTNATPFKTKANRYYCAYCSTDGPVYEDPDVLRTHTRTKHVSERTLKIEYAMRPHWMNETVKLDIDNLLCVVCCLPISTWNEMFKHLKESHEIVLDQSYSRVIPYNLKSELNCSLCKEPYSNIMLLEAHMNAHYNNYVCDDCGDTFLSEKRLKQHMKIHDTGKFPCSMCPKIFSLAKYKKKHEELVHKNLLKFKCSYCDDRFYGEYLRHVHIVEKHKEKVKIITCEFCGKTFTWRPYYITHKKKYHVSDPKKFDCQECGKKFFLQAELKEHMLRHTGEKHFLCTICGKKYISSGSLRHHRNWHKKHGSMPPS